MVKGFNVSGCSYGACVANIIFPINRSPLGGALFNKFSLYLHKNKDGLFIDPIAP
jgi:hypothetical protein